MLLAAGHAARARDPRAHSACSSSCAGAAASSTRRPNQVRVIAGAADARSTAAAPASASTRDLALVGRRAWPRDRDDVDGRVERDDLPDLPHRVSRHDVLHARRTPAGPARRDARRPAAQRERWPGSLGQERRSGVHGVLARVRARPAQLSSHDGNELVPFPVYNATRPRHRGSTETSMGGVVARICPVCATKYDLNARFCGIRRWRPRGY